MNKQHVEHFAHTLFSRIGFNGTALDFVPIVFVWPSLATSLCLGKPCLISWICDIAQFCGKIVIVDGKQSFKNHHFWLNYLTVLV